MKKLIDNFVTILMVTVITVLVWLYAEDANVKQFINQRVELHFVTTDGQALILEPASTVVLVSFNGSNGQYHRFQDRVNGQALQVKVPYDPNSLDVEIDLKREFEDKLLQDIGISLTDIDPPVIPIHVEPIDIVTLDVDVHFSGPITPTILSVEPTQITMQLPRRIAERLRDQGLKATADFSELNLNDIPRGEDAVHTFKITPPRFALPNGFTDADIHVSHTEAQITYRIPKTTDELTIERRVVGLYISPSIQDRYDLRLPEDVRVINDFKIEGPPAFINQLVADQASRTLRLKIVFDDLAEFDNLEFDEDGVAPISKEIQLDISGPHEVRLITTLERLDLEVRRRENAPE